ncbi:hypothetical protein DFH06DRAFT_1175040 [Mycena polygramma]|nr:hypothetical protein DFH06DRAFT_1175040 [Mycena polygramma]
MRRLLVFVRAVSGFVICSAQLMSGLAAFFLLCGLSNIDTPTCVSCEPVFHGPYSRHANAVNLNDPTRAHIKPPTGSKKVRRGVTAPAAHIHLLATVSRVPVRSGVGPLFSVPEP